MIPSRMPTSDDVDKQITEENSPSTSSSNPLLVSPLETASKTPEENYKISLAIFKNLDAAAQNTKFGSQRSKRNSEFYDPSLSSSLHDVPPILKSCPSLGQSFTSTGKYYLRQSLYGTVRMNPLKSFPTVFNSKSLTGVASLKLEENESADSFEDEGNPESPAAASLNFFHGNYHQIKDNPSYLSDNEEEDGANLEHVSTQEDLKAKSTRFNDPAASDGISLTSDYDSVSTGSTSTTCNGTECTLSTKEESTSQFSNQPIATSNQSDKVIESDNSINSCRFTGSNNRSNNNNYSSNNNNKNSNNNAVVETNNKTSLQAKLSKIELTAESKNVDSNRSLKTPAVSDEKHSSHRSDVIDQKSSANFVSLPAIPSDRISPTFKKPDHTSISNSITACPTSKGAPLDPGSEVTTSEKGEVRVRERETLTTIRLRARSSTICKRREKLKSKAEDVAEEFRQKGENSQGLPGGKLDEVRKTLENLNLSQTNLSNISTLVRSKSHLAGIQQSIKVERTEKEIHFIQQLDPTISCNNNDSGNSNDNTIINNNSSNNNTIINNINNNIILTTTQPTTGSVTKEFSEIFLDAENFQVEINNIVCCETISLKPTFPQTSDRSTSEQSNGKSMTDHLTPTVIPSGCHPTFEASSSPPPTSSPPLSSSSSPPPPSSSSPPSPSSSSSSSSSNIFKVTSVLLIRTTIIDMTTTPERKRIFREMNEEFANDKKDNHHHDHHDHPHHHHHHHHHQSSKGDLVQVIVQDGEANPGDDQKQVEKKKLSEEEFSVFCCKMKELSALETFLV